MIYLELYLKSIFSIVFFNARKNYNKKKVNWKKSGKIKYFKKKKLKIVCQNFFKRVKFEFRKTPKNNNKQSFAQNRFSKAMIYRCFRI